MTRKAIELKEGAITAIHYVSESTDEESTRVIIPTSVPKDTIRAIDVSELTAEDQATIGQYVTEYKEYISAVFQTAYKFEDWVEHAHSTHFKPKWRTFKLNGIRSE